MTREWLADVLRENDANQISMLTQSLVQFRQDDKFALRR